MNVTSRGAYFHTSRALPGSHGRQPKLFLQLKGASLAGTTATIAIACVVAQFALGTDPVVLALATIACLAGLAGVRIVGAYHAAGWLVFFFTLGNVIVALVAKTILLQPLESNLYAPFDSFLVLAAGSVVLLIALVFSVTIPVGETLFRPVRNVRLLRWLSNSAFALGTMLWYLNRLFQDPQGSGFGGLAVFWNLVLMAVIAHTEMVLEQSDGRRSVDAHLLLILVALVAVGLIDNSKTEVALPIVAYFATSLFYRRGITLRQAAAGLVGLILMASLVGPMIHIHRSLGIQDLPWQERVALIERGVKDASVVGRLELYKELSYQQFLSGYYNYFGEGRGQMLVGRYASIQQIDPVIANVSRHGTQGGAVIWPFFTRLLPSLVYPDKPRYIESYYLLVHLGLIDPEGGKYPTVPIVAQSYAGYGATGLLVIPFLTFLGFMLALKKLGWRLYRNIFATFFFSVFTVVYANQGDLGQYAGSVLRSFPLLAAVLWLSVCMYRIRIRYHPSVPQAAASLAVESTPRP